MGAAKSGDEEVRVGEVFMECNGKAGLLVLVSCGRAKMALGGAQDGSRRKMQLAGSKDGGSVYTDQNPGVQNGHCG